MTRLQTLFQNPRAFLLGLAYMLPAILLGLTLHEWAHAFAAYKLGDPTARNLGRLSLNPVDHIDPIGLICLFLIGFGWAKPVPINPRNFNKPRRDELIVSLAGIAMNLLEVIVFSLIFVLFLRWKPSLVYNNAYVTILSEIIFVNVTLAVFNLIPIQPLDGSHVLECLFGRYMSYNFRLFMYKYGRFILLILLYTGLLDYPIGWAQGVTVKGINLLLKLFGSYIRFS